MVERRMTRYRTQVAAALRATTVTSHTSFAWFGARSRPLPATVLATLPSATARRYLVDTLEHELYRSFYTQGGPVPAQPDRSGPTRADDEFVHALSEANCGSGGWEPGWEVARIARRTVHVTRGGLAVSAPVADCRGASGRPTAGAAVSLRRPKELVAGAPGFYLALGDASPGPQRHDAIEVRVYFNVTAAGALPLVLTCTRTLNEARVPFSLKVVDNPASFSRCDTAVLYLAQDGFDGARGPLAAIASACAPHLRRESPAFTKPLTPGVALGEHLPHLGTSFGSNRCRLVAEGILAAHERGERALTERVDAVTRRFTEEGLDIDAPYLAPGSNGTYGL
jgi:class II lanthipeptide synthase